MSQTFDYDSVSKKLTPVKTEKEINYRIEKGPYNPSKRTRFKGRWGSDGSYADID